jgi:L,D-transpeptidase-like protein
MRNTSNLATRLSGSRVALIAVSLIVLPSFTISGRDRLTASGVDFSTPVGVDEAAAEAVGVAPERAAAPAVATTSPANWNQTTLGSVDPKVFALALSATHCAVKSGAVENPATLTVIDYSKPSTTTRLWVYNLRNRELMYEELVAHGQGSGDNYATRFSNEPETHRTSIGLFVTDDTYVGKNGYSLRLNGLDTGFNDRARERAIVMHGAPYVNADFVKAQGRLGRSWGCPALRDGVARKVIDTVKDGGIVFSYYPDQNWLKSSKYLGDCAAAN